MGKKYKSKTLFRCEVSESGKIVGLEDDWKDRIAAKFAGNNIRIEVKVDEKPKTVPQLGYFFGVVLPFYMYGLIDLGNDLEIGSKADEEMVEKYLKDKHLKNGPVWNTVNRSEIKAPSKVGELVVSKINKTGYIEKGGPLMLFAKVSDTEKFVKWTSPKKGKLEVLVSEGEVISPGAVIAHVDVVDSIMGPASLASASVNEVIRFIDRVKREANEFLGVTIPDADPYYNHEVKLKNVLREKLKGIKIIACKQCSTEFEQAESFDSPMYNLCQKCLV